MDPWNRLLREAERLGLTVAGHAAWGAIDGRPVAVDAGTPGSGALWLKVRGLIDPPMDLGLELGPRATASILPPATFTGHPDLDAELEGSADDRDRARGLFTVPLCDAIVALYRRGFDLRLDDHGCSIFAAGSFAFPDVAWLDGAARGAAEVASLMDQARAHLPPADRLRDHAEAIGALATRHHLPVEVSHTPLRARGVIEGRALEIGATRTGARKYHLYARGELEGELGIGLSLRRRALLDGVRAILGDHEAPTGDEAFDHRFHVHASRPDRVPALIDEAVRGLLVSLDDRAGPVSADDRGLTIDSIPIGVPLDEIIVLAERIIEATRRISHNLLHGGAEGGPYR